MSRHTSFGLLSAACIAACAGMATSASGITITPQNVYLWTGYNYGAGVGNAPGAVGYNGGATPTWAWNAGSMASQPWIDSTGRIYATGAFNSTPGIASMATTTTTFGIFTATTGINNSPNLSLYQSWATGQTDPGTGLKIGNNAGSNQGMSTSSTLRVSGSTVGLGVQVGNSAGTGTNAQESQSGTGTAALLQNNTVLYTGNFGSQSLSARMARTVSVPNTNDWTATPSGVNTVNDITNYRTTPTQQFSALNSSGTWALPFTLATVGPNPAAAATSATATVAATTGNASFLGTMSASGATTVIARAGDLPYGAGGPQFKGGNNGVSGFYMKINRNGQVAYDASFQSVGTTGNPGPGGVTTANDSSAWIYTPGAGTQGTRSTQVYQESLNVPIHLDPATGASTSNGSATFTGGVSSGNRAFSNAGWFYTATPTGGDTVTTSGIANDQFVMISTAAGGMTPTWVMRKNDIAPGFSAASNVHAGNVNTTSMAMNNAGTVAYYGGLQSTSTAAVQPAVGFQWNQFGDGLVTAAGIAGNDAAMFVGTPGITGNTGLRAVVRNGDAAPGIVGAYINFSGGSTPTPALNNAGDVVFGSGLTAFAPGSAIGVVGQPAATSAADAFVGIQALWAYNASTYGLVQLLYTNMPIEVDTGVIKYVSQFSTAGVDNGDGGSMTLNDNGQLVEWVRLSDTPGGSATSTSYIVLQVPAAGTGSMALLGLGVMARRRRR